MAVKAALGSLLFVVLMPVPLGGQASDAASGWSATHLDEVRRFTDSIGTAAFVLVTDGRVVASWGRTTHPFRAHSMRKSILSALIGIAVDRHQIDTAATLSSLAIDDGGKLTPAEQAATVLQLLQSRSGVYLPAASETAEARATRPQRGSREPGSHWYYNNWDFNALGEIYSGRTGRTIGEAFRDQLAHPLGMEDFDVQRDFRYQLEPEYSSYPSYKFRISARDLARFGQLFLQEGRWEGTEIVPRDWVRESTRAHSVTGEAGTKSGYGLMWWVTSRAGDGLPTGSYTASGSGGQRLTVLPQIATVVVHLMDTDLDDGPRIGTSTYNELLRRVLAAHPSRPRAPRVEPTVGPTDRDAPSGVSGARPGDRRPASAEVRGDEA